MTAIVILIFIYVVACCPCFTELDDVFLLLHQTQLRAGTVIVFSPVRNTAGGHLHFRKEKKSTADFKAT